MDTIKVCLGTLQDSYWTLSVYAQLRLDTNQYREVCYRRVPEIPPELWLHVQDKVFISDNFVGIAAFASSLKIDFANVARARPQPFAKLFCCWAWGVDTAVVIDAGTESEVPGAAMHAMWKLKLTPVKIFSPVISEDRLSFHTYHSTFLGGQRFLQQIVQFSISLLDFSFTRSTVGEFTDEG